MMPEAVGAPDEGVPIVDPLLASVRALGEVMDRFEETAARALGIARSDLRALNLLEHGPVPVGEIATRLGLSGSSATALVDRLVAGGYVSRHAVPGDRRKVLVQLEPATYSAFARVYGPCGLAVASVARDLSEPDLDVTRRVLGRVVAALAAEEAGLGGGVVGP